MEFPQYRKLPGFKRFYKIVDDKNFIETYELNGEKITHTILAVQFPEMLRIKDMLEFNWNFEEMSAEEITEHF